MALTSIFALLLAETVVTGVPAYDLHTKALVPVRENVRPSGEPLELVKDGAYRFAIAWNAGCERDCGPYKPTMPSITPALEILKEAFAHTFGKEPDVIDANDPKAANRYAHVIALGASPLTRRLGFDPAKEPDQGFTVATVGKTLVLHGNDSSQIPGYNAKDWEKRGSSRGTYYAALDFAERFLGVRYFFPGEWGTLWRPAKDFTVNPVSYTDRPHFNHRGGMFFFNSTLLNDALVAKWTRLMGEGAVKRGDGSFVLRWRDGGTRPSGGGHAPDPQKFGNRHSNVVDRCFFKNPYGYRAFYPNQHYPNLYDVTNLELIDHLVEDIKRQFAGPQPKWDTLGWPSLSRTYVPWGQCDTYMSLVDVAFNPTVRELGLVNPADLERARQPDGYLRNDAGCFANIWGRFVKAYAERVQKEFPGEKLYCLVYYNAKFPPNDPRWKLPDNVEISFCDHRLPRRLFNANDRADIVRIAKEWYDALGGRPVARAWLYNDNENGSRFTRAVNPEFTGLVPKTLGQYLGDDCCFFDYNGVSDIWHFYYAAYASFHSQWNPDFDVDAAIDEHWAPFYGEAAGAKLQEFHALLKQTVIRHLCRPDGLSEDEKYATPVPAETLDRLEKLFAEAEAAVEKGTVFERRFRLFAEPWPEAFKKRREELAQGPRLTPEERKVWKRKDIRIDSWDDVYTRFEQNPNPYKTNRSALQMEFANPLTRYSFNVTAAWPTDKNGVKQSFSVGQGRQKYGFIWGDSVTIMVNGQSYKDLEIFPTDITPWAHGEAHGYEIKLNFVNAPMTLRVSLRPDSHNLRFELIPGERAKVESAQVRISAVPSFFETPDGKTRFNGYRREIATATRTIEGRNGAKPVELTAEDRYVVFRDADYDGSGPDKGVGPCAAFLDFKSAETVRAQATDYWQASVTADLKPRFTSFRFALYQDLDRPCSNADFKLHR